MPGLFITLQNVPQEWVKRILAIRAENFHEYIMYIKNNYFQVNKIEFCSFNFIHRVFNFKDIGSLST